MVGIRGLARCQKDEACSTDGCLAGWAQLHNQRWLTSWAPPNSRAPPLLHAPRLAPNLTHVQQVGTGVQILLAALVTLLLAALGFLSPAARGALVTCGMIFFVLLAGVAGFMSVYVWGLMERTYTGWQVCVRQQLGPGWCLGRAWAEQPKAMRPARPVRRTCMRARLCGVGSGGWAPVSARLPACVVAVRSSTMICMRHEDVRMTA